MSPLTLITALCVGCMASLSYGEMLEAKCVIEASSGDPAKPITGTVMLKQASSTAATVIDVNLSGFETTESGKKHGFHIHASGNLGNKCSDAGGHYNPFTKEHGGPTNSERHVGDLGNVVVNNLGKVVVKITDNLVKLSGENSVVGRAIVVHAGEDDLGLGGEVDSTTTGHAGARWACCKIEKVESPNSASHVALSSMLAVLLLSIYIIM